MKQLRVLAGVLTGLLLSAGATAQSTTAGTTPLATLPVAWNTMGNGGPQTLPGRCEVGIDSQKPADGAPLYSIRCMSTVLPSFGGARTNYSANPYRGKRVRVSASLMATGIESVPNAQYPNVAGEAGLWIGVATPQGGLKQNRMQGRTIKGSTGWETHDFVVDIPADASQLQAGFWMQGKGQLWMRDLKVEQVPLTVAVNWDRDAPSPDAVPALSLAPVSAARSTDIFLPPPERWLALGEQNFELCDAGIDARMLAAGQRNLSIACPVPVRAYLRHTFEAQPWWGKRVRLSAWLKTEKVEPKSDRGEQPGAAMYLSTSGSGGTIYNAVVTGTTDWKYHEIVIDIPVGSASPYIPMGLSLIGTGQLWARDFRFEEVSRDTPVTRLPASALPIAEQTMAANDQNGDGIITRKEAENADQPLIRMWDAYDANKDGNVDAAEVVEANNRFAAMKGQARRTGPDTIISSNDRNGDGVVTKEEAAQVNGSLSRNWPLFDLNNDGRTDRAEVVKSLAE